jgi:hypothetical protein
MGIISKLKKIVKFYFLVVVGSLCLLGLCGFVDCVETPLSRLCCFFGFS